MSRVGMGTLWSVFGHKSHVQDYKGLSVIIESLGGSFAFHTSSLVSSIRKCFLGDSEHSTTCLTLYTEEHMFQRGTRNHRHKRSSPCESHKKTSKESLRRRIPLRRGSFYGPCSRVLPKVGSSSYTPKPSERPRPSAASLPLQATKYGLRVTRAAPLPVGGSFLYGCSCPSRCGSDFPPTTHTAAR